MAKTETETGCGGKAIKCYFGTLNSLLLIFGLSAIVAGVVAVQGFTMDSWPPELNDLLENEYVGSFALFVILTGVVCFVLGVFGLISTFKYINVYPLLVYVLILIILGIAQLAIGGFALVSGKIEDAPMVGATLHEELENLIKEDYCGDLITGVDGSEKDMVGSTDLYNKKSIVYHDSFGCTVIAADEAQCKDGAFSPVDADPRTCVEQTNAEAALHQECLGYADACFDIVEGDLIDNMTIVGFVSLGMGLCELFGAWCGFMVAMINKRALSAVSNYK